MRKFEIGDRVKILRDTINSSVGKTGVLEGFHKREELYFVNLGREHYGHHGSDDVVDSSGNRIEIVHRNGRWFLPNELELDKESKVLEILRNYKKLKI